MITLFALLSILLAIASAAYLQLPTFILALGYRWFHNYKTKRWFTRMLAILAFALFLYLCPPLWAIVAAGIPFTFLIVFSLLNANPKVYIALREKQIIKRKEIIYPGSTEILGYADEYGNAIAYLLMELVKPRHLLNDVFMGNPLFVSYCMACRSAMIYDPVVDGTRLNFEVLGVYRRNMVMSDIETGTVWQQGTGEAMFGKMKGTQLTYLPYQQMTLSEWLKLYPSTFIAKESDAVKDGIFSKRRLMKMMKVTEKLVAPGKTDLTGLPLRENIFGVTVGDVSKAYPVSELKKTKGIVEDKIGDTQVSINYNSKTNHISIIEKESGKPLVAQSHWWFGWKEFHPETEIWKA
jgi:hypothetical protein